jgi:hypothetical protein
MNLQIFAEAQNKSEEPISKGPLKLGTIEAIESALTVELFPSKKGSKEESLTADLERQTLRNAAALELARQAITTDGLTPSIQTTTKPELSNKAYGIPDPYLGELIEIAEELAAYRKPSFTVPSNGSASPSSTFNPESPLAEQTEPTPPPPPQAIKERETDYSTITLSGVSFPRFSRESTGSEQWREIRYQELHNPAA